MKKILWLIFLLVLGVKVEAKEVYYSDYSNFSEFQQEEVINSDIVEVEKEERYLWYKEIQEEQDYQLYNLEDSFSDDCYFTEYSNWQNEKIDNPGYIYDERNVYQYTKAKSVRYIHLYNLQGSYGAFRMTELAIKVNNKEIDYKYTCEGCLSGFDDYINNGIYDENKSYINNGGSLIIDLGKQYPLNQIEVIFYIFDLGPSDKLYTIGYSTDKKDIFIAQSYILNFADEYWDNALKVVKKITDLNISLQEWTTSETSYEVDDDTSIVDTKVTKQYRYQEKWCKVYQKKKEYYQEYSNKAIDDYIYRDEESKKTFYRYRTRDKLEIDVYDITDENFDLNNFIITSTDEVEITNNIDWNKNGIYDITFTLNDLIVTKSVILNIDSNTIDELEKEILILEQQISNLEEDLKKQKKYYEEQLEILEEKLNNCQSDNNCLKEILEEKELIIKNQEEQLISLNDKINQLQAEINSKIDEIIYLNQNNELLKDKITKLNAEIIKLKNNTSNLNQEVINEYNKTNDLIIINQFYKEKIDELTEDLNLLNESTNKKLTDKNNLINQYEQKIKELEDKLNENQCLTDLKKEQNTNEDLNNKLNNYVLKITSNRIFDITMIVLFLLLLLYVIFKNQKPKK